MVRLTDRPDMTLDVYSGSKTTTQKQQPYIFHCQNLLTAVYNRLSVLLCHCFKPTVNSYGHAGTVG